MHSCPGQAPDRRLPDPRQNCTGGTVDLPRLEEEGFGGVTVLKATALENHLVQFAW